MQLLVRAEAPLKIVVDASALIAVVANEPEKEALIRLTAGAELVAPASVHWEVGNALSAMMKRRRIGVDEAVRASVLYRAILVLCLST